MTKPRVDQNSPHRLGRPVRSLVPKTMTLGIPEDHSKQARVAPKRSRREEILWMCTAENISYFWPALRLRGFMLDGIIFLIVKNPRCHSPDVLCGCRCRVAQGLRRNVHYRWSWFLLFAGWRLGRRLDGWRRFSCHVNLLYVPQPIYSSDSLSIQGLTMRAIVTFFSPDSISRRIASFSEAIRFSCRKADILSA